MPSRRSDTSPRAVLIFAYGNPSRGDDALGPALLERIERDGVPEQVQLLTDFQLQIEHAMDLKGRRLVLFVDADQSVLAPFALTPIKPEEEIGYTTHAMSPAAVLSVYQRIESNPAPPCFVLRIRGYGFELGAPLSEKAEANLGAAVRRVHRLLATATPDSWNEPTAISSQTEPHQL
jgi:hydrogenase maturation protease